MCQRSQRLRGHTSIASFREYLRENSPFCETVFACSYWAQVAFFYTKISEIS